MNSEILIGCDPEVFVTHNGAIISAEGLVGGTKDYPRAVRGGTLQEDNVLAELGTTPTSCPLQFAKLVTSVLSQLQRHLQKHDALLDFKVLASATLPDYFLGSTQALSFGCEPDYDAWTGDMNPAPACRGNLRTAGGHIHIGFDSSVYKVSQRDVIKAADVLIGLPSVLQDGDTTRMKMYGKAGAFRYKPYGVEYRTPSNYWLSSEVLMHWVHAQATASVSAAANYDFMQNVVALSDDIRETINTANTVRARELCDYFDVQGAA